MIRIICVGKLKEQYLSDLVNDYLKRINKYHKLEIIELNDSNKESEGKLILSKLNLKAYKVGLTIEGKKYTSLEFSNFIDKSLMNYGNIDFIIGGSNGLSKEVINILNNSISFSDLTFPHGLFRGILLEQIYRSFKIINNETYHK